MLCEKAPLDVKDVNWYQTYLSVEAGKENKRDEEGERSAARLCKERIARCQSKERQRTME